VAKAAPVKAAKATGPVKPVKTAKAPAQATKTTTKPVGKLETVKAKVSPKVTPEPKNVKAASPVKPAKSAQPAAKPQAAPKAKPLPKETAKPTPPPVTSKKTAKAKPAPPEPKSVSPSIQRNRELEALNLYAAAMEAFNKLDYHQARDVLQLLVSEFILESEIASRARDFLKICEQKLKIF
jgi:hypothetical protein